ncbi:hypothetical protein [Alteraurantiacibacter aestuarii]|uniref:Uncharacterized protein n=1 Tax=Alteraurantiacibacter aestuarii TaxID=650004 RepID=A0A844ZI24_9SPHN|nr:hypothetical protein [Alteraurantiacibacter aestuarii]MXO87214.1 hypothetical protein [Alteraurantiacibacter aestuarii]
MTEERITETHDQAGNTHTTIVRDTPQSSSGGAGKWIVILIVLMAVVAAAYFIAQGSGAEIAKDNAIGEAAGQVGEAAQQVGNAVEDVADNVTGDE